MKRFIVCVLALCLACSGAEAAVVDGSVRLGIVKFQPKAEGITELQAASIGDIFTRILAGSKTIITVERDQFESIASEQKLSMSGLVTDDTAVQLGKILGCNYMLIGSVTRYEHTTSTTDLWMVAKKQEQAVVTIDARIVDVETTKVVLSLSETGKNSQEGSVLNFYGLSDKDKMDFKGIEAGAIADSVSRLAFKLRENLTGEQVEVVKPGSKEIIVSLGQRNGAQIGGLYRVYSEGQEIFDSEGNSLGREMHDIAVVKITKLQPEFSNAVVAAGGAGRLALVQKGDKLYPVTSEELESMIANKVFPEERPRVRKSRRKTR